MNDKNRTWQKSKEHDNMKLKTFSLKEPHIETFNAQKKSNLNKMKPIQIIGYKSSAYILKIR